MRFSFSSPAHNTNAIRASKAARDLPIQALGNGSTIEHDMEQKEAIKKFVGSPWSDQFSATQNLVFLVLNEGTKIAKRGNLTINNPNFSFAHGSEVCFPPNIEIINGKIDSGIIHFCKGTVTATSNDAAAFGYGPEATAFATNNGTAMTFPNADGVRFTAIMPK